MINAQLRNMDPIPLHVTIKRSINAHIPEVMNLSEVPDLQSVLQKAPQKII